MKQNILFLCTGNSCRSQMAEALLNTLRPDEYTAFSAGTDPHGVNPNAIKVLSEIGIDISSAKSKSVMQFLDKEIEYVITLCGSAKETCPIFPGDAKVMHNGFDDPPELTKNMIDEDEILSVYRRVRDEIKNFILDINNFLK